MLVLIDSRLVRELRIKHSYSQERLAEIVGVNPRTIQRIESNGVASLSTRGALVQALGVSPEDLDIPEASAVVATQGRAPSHWLRWSFFAVSAVLVLLVATVLALSIKVQ